MKPIKCSLMFLVAIAGLLTSTACTPHLPPTAVPGPDFPYALMMQESDLPPGWERDGGSFPDVPGDAVAYGVGFRYTSGEFGKITSHKVAIYPDLQAAIDAYPQWESQWFNPHWLPVRDTTFHVGDASDDMRFEYLDVKINGVPVRSYRYLQRHCNAIVLVLMNVDNASITFHQFEEALQHLDDRLQSVPCPLKAEHLQISE